MIKPPLTFVLYLPNTWLGGALWPVQVEGVLCVVATALALGVAARRTWGGDMGHGEALPGGAPSETGERAAHKQGGTKRCKLDPHRDYLLGLIDGTPDLTISELLEKLLAQHGVKVSRSTLWTYLDRCGLTFKKRPSMRASRTAPTLRSGAKPGSRDNSISTLKSSSSSTKPG